jgi:hypothetical protein
LDAFAASAPSLELPTSAAATITTTHPAPQRSVSTVCPLLFVVAFAQAQGSDSFKIVAKLLC